MKRKNKLLHANQPQELRGKQNVPTANGMATYARNFNGELADLELWATENGKHGLAKATHKLRSQFIQETGHNGEVVYIPGAGCHYEVENVNWSALLATCNDNDVCLAMAAIAERFTLLNEACISEGIGPHYPLVAGMLGLASAMLSDAIAETEN
jgi:hypothetical protein